MIKKKGKEQKRVSKIDLKGNPFFLNAEQIKWVETTYEEMSLEEKIGQIMLPESARHG